MVSGSEENGWRLGTFRRAASPRKASGGPHRGAGLLKQINQQVANYEQLQFIVIANAPWGIENGCLTPTMKIKRNRIEDMVKTQVDAWYGQNQDVIWA